MNHNRSDRIADICSCIWMLFLACEFSENHDTGKTELVCPDPENVALENSQARVCNAARAIQLGDTELKGSLSGCGTMQDWCGGNGHEDVFFLQPLDDIDISFVVIADKSNFSPILRVFSQPLERSPAWDCEKAQPPRSQPICQTLSLSTPRASFFAQRQQKYFVVVDSETSSNSQNYTISIEYGATKSLEVCPEHLLIESLRLSIPEQRIFAPSRTISSAANASSPNLQQPDNDVGSTPKKITISRHGLLPQGQGMLHSRCGGSGSEHVFAIQFEDPGIANLRVVSDNSSFEPILTLRDDCSGNGVIEFPTNCDSTAVNYQSALTYENFETDLKYIVVDQRGVSGGGYRLYIDYEPFFVFN